MSIYIEDYKNKSFVVRGNTIEYKDSIKSLGGKWNSNLTDNNGEKFGAWLFWKDKRPEISKWINNGAKKINDSSNNFSSNKSELEEKIDYLTVLVKALCEANNIPIDNYKLSSGRPKIRNTSAKNAIISDSVFTENDFLLDDDTQETTVKPHKRLI